MESGYGFLVRMTYSFYFCWKWCLSAFIMFLHVLSDNAMFQNSSRTFSGYKGIYNMYVSYLPM